MKRLITIIGVLAIASSAMAASVSYTDTWGDTASSKMPPGTFQDDWALAAGAVSKFRTDPTIPAGWSGNNLMLQALYGDKGITNDLNDGSAVSDPMAAGEYVGPTAGQNVKLSSAWRNYAAWGSASTQLTLTLSGPSHSISIINPGGGGDYDETNWFYQIDGGAVTDTGVAAITNGGTGVWDGIFIEVGLSNIEIGVEAIGAAHPGGASTNIGGSYSDWMFDTITIENDASECVRTGYLAAVTLTGEIVPEPASLLLLVVGLPFLRRRR